MKSASDDKNLRMCGCPWHGQKFECAVNILFNAPPFKKQEGQHASHVNVARINVQDLSRQAGTLFVGVSDPTCACSLDNRLHGRQVLTCCAAQWALPGSSEASHLENTNLMQLVPAG
eukprot:CAMPEP_0204193188 /NCGR_PEP_ID=MMETSP0361-20130328/61479_1 /ASSEMBLY_ACC=CAM_ASM_000343 /TAXON_ID=268821 /ORGANISM="Scrippsiella Hangoei, Strain SHTV-5" /LENGTH=116 /DNA_ID=CAMNT_0051154363 /DNA_START=432 /DNA_END=782 /DNA_ORIENTATION=-